MKLPSIHTQENLAGRRVLVRMGLNVPVENGAVTDGFRLDVSLSTLKFLQDSGAKIILIGHKSSVNPDDDDSLLPAFSYLKEVLGTISFYPRMEINEEVIAKTHELSPGEMLLFENLRRDSGEKDNDENFTHALASLADLYVNEAFAASHRRHASIVGVPTILPSFFGERFISEVDNLSCAHNPKHPFYIVLGGAKFNTKLPIVEKFLPLAEKIFIYGALAHDIISARGYEVGKSLISEGTSIEHLAHNEKIFIPQKVVVQSDNEIVVKDYREIGKDDTIVDAAPESIKEISKEISDAQFILWNGPLGNYEKGYSAGTEQLAKAIAEHNVFSIVGGGDTVAAIKKLHIRDKFGFVSTGGGAMLDFLAHRTLPGIEAILKR